jgi:diacylglycerol kinase (ATP)
LTPDYFRRAELIACLLAVLAVELLNTSIEKLCDHTTPQFDPAIKIIKDMGSAAVFCALCMAGVVWIGAVVARFP